jgi:hypothetical protein
MISVTKESALSMTSNVMIIMLVLMIGAMKKLVIAILPLLTVMITVSAQLIIALRVNATMM